MPSGQSVYTEEKNTLAHHPLNSTAPASLPCEYMRHSKNLPGPCQAPQTPPPARVPTLALLRHLPYTGEPAGPAGYSRLSAHLAHSLRALNTEIAAPACQVSSFQGTAAALDQGRGGRVGYRTGRGKRRACNQLRILHLTVIISHIITHRISQDSGASRLRCIKRDHHHLPRFKLTRSRGG